MSRAERILDRDIKALLHRNPSLQAFSDALDQSSWADWTKTGKRKGSKKDSSDPYSPLWDGISKGKLSI